MSQPTQDMEFWRERLRSQEDPLKAISFSCDFQLVDAVHRVLVSRFISSTDRVLDVGCGIGRTAHWFDDYVGIDFLPEFIEIARKSHPHKEFHVAKISQLPEMFDRDSFDWAVAISVKGVVPTPEWDEGTILKVAKRLIVLPYTDPINTWEVYE